MKYKALATLAATAALFAGGLLAAPAPAFAAGTTYYVSSSTGSDANAGTTMVAPLRTLGAINARTFQPGDQILLKRGDIWTGSSLIFTQSGNAGAPISLSAYGSGALPKIAPGIVDGWGVRLDGVGYWRINNIAVSNTREAIVLTYNDVSDKKDIAIDSVQISDLTPQYNSQPGLYNHTSTGITVKTYQSTDDGSGSNKANPPTRRTALTGFSVTNSTFRNVGAATWFGGLIVDPGTGFQSGSHQWTKNVIMDNLQVDNGGMWGFNVLFVSGGVFTNLRSYDTGALPNTYGTAAFVIAYSQDLAFDRVHIRNVSRHPNQEYDAAGFDFEGVGDNISLTNSVIDLTDGAGLMMFNNSGLPMTDINVDNVTVSRWGRSPGANTATLDDGGVRVDSAGGSGQLSGLTFLNAYNRPTARGSISSYRVLDTTQSTVSPSSVAPAPITRAPSTASPALQFGALGAARNDVSHQVGLKFSIQANTTVTALGRFADTGNYRPHSVNIYSDATKAVVARCVVYPTLAVAADGLRYCTLSSQTTLPPGTYWLLSAERAGGDVFRETTPTSSASGVTVVGAASLAGGSFTVWGGGPQGYGPVGLK